ncbi:MAG: histidine phosphatase family protein [Actinomycetaceae bacterium]|nr:histidine phosphatase family protein [Actinomycetaceae bacterium]MDU0969979.1 histidine phosphatase family protein [Actinomycetaceae bacterium]
MELILVRHGQTSSNIIDALDTDFPGAPLNARGKAQAAGIPAEWERLGIGAPDAIIASPLVRTRQTARPLARHFGLPILADVRLREVRAGDLEMLHDADAPAAYLSFVCSWLHGDDTRRMPGAEIGAHVVGRVTSLVREVERVFGSDSRICFVTHGGVTRLFSASMLGGITPDLVMSQPVRNCSITRATGSVAGGFEADLYSSKPIEEWEVIPGLTALRRSIQVIDPAEWR